ncbi:MAG: (2Fe-2S)-binding protein [Sarcina sp.]
MENIANEKIVCRCKKVNAGTIINAIKNGADTLEKIKEKTSANAYGCYGCTLQVKKLIDANK